MPTIESVAVFSLTWTQEHQRRYFSSDLKFHVPLPKITQLPYCAFLNPMALPPKTRLTCLVGHPAQNYDQFLFALRLLPNQDPSFPYIYYFVYCVCSSRLWASHHCQLTPY